MDKLPKNEIFDETLEKLHCLAELTSDIIFELDENYIITFVYKRNNPADSIPASKYAGLCIFDIIKDEGASQTSKLFSSVLNGDLQRGCVTYVDETGSHIEIGAIATKRGGLFCTVRNLSQRLSRGLGKCDSSFVGTDYNAEDETEKALSKQLMQQELLAMVSLSFASSDSFDDSVNYSLSIFGQFLKADRMYIFEDNHDKMYFRCVYEWASEGTMRIFPHTQAAPYDDQHDSYLQLLTLPFVAIGDTDILPLSEHQKPKELGILAFINVPIFADGKFWGFLGVDSCKTKRNWTKNETELLSTFVGILSTVIEKRNAEKKLLAANIQLEKNVTELTVMGENLKAAVEVAKQASRAKSEFLSKMSHEIRTPMNAVMGMVAVAKKSDSVHHIKTCLEKIDNASTQLLGILNDILDISKIESGKFEIYLSEFRLDKTLEGLYDIISTRTNEKSQKLDFEVNFDFSRKIICDELRLTQVIMNLLTNAVKFTPEYGVIKLKLGHERSGENKERLTVEVSDTGIGLNKEQAERLFMPFEQADGSITRRFGGTGLGLAISKSIVEHLGGQISVNGVPGEGSSFKFFVEFEWGGPAFDKAEASDVPNTIHEGIWRGKKILLVEDIEVNREIVHMCLEITGVQIDDAENGVKALEIMKTRGGDYSLLLMDIQMPDMDGITCTKNLRLQGIDIPIIAMTANAFKEDVSECLSAGMSDHISKPFNFDELLSKLKCYL